MLANTLSMEDEEAVQAELRQLQAEAVSAIYLYKRNFTLNLRPKVGCRGNRKTYHTSLSPRECTGVERAER